MLLAGTGQRFGNGAHTATRETPGTDAAIDVSHNMVEKNVGRSWRIDTKRCADNARTGHRRLDKFVLEVVVEKVGGTHCKETNVLVDLALTEFPELLGEVEKLADIAWPHRSRLGRRA